MKKIVQSIKTATGGKLDLLVATHEHKDHVSGFGELAREFKDKVAHVWMAWTENPDDGDAKNLKKYQTDLGAAVAAAARALSAGPNSDDESKKLGNAVRDLFEFAGDAAMPGLAGFAKTIDAAMHLARSGLGVQADYLNPGGRAREESWLPGFRFYVLGPPRSHAALKELGEHGSDELYHFASGLRLGAAAHSNSGSASGPECEREMPFDGRHRLKQDDPLIADLLKDYLHPENSWRKIDNEWLRAGSDLALQLDSLTNNTSLALAIERISDGKVFLFPADAQQGNWVSWHDAKMKWTVTEPSGATRTVRAGDLLARTVFYKAGHHGSHNATARGKGLELMGREDELVAFIPVDRKIALGRSPAGTWKMPQRALYKRLLEKCQGRVVRADLGWADNAADAADKTTEAEFIGLADSDTWSKWKASQAKMTLGEDSLYFECSF